MTAYESLLPSLESALAFSLPQAAWWGVLLGLAAAGRCRTTALPAASTTTTSR